MKQNYLSSEMRKCKRCGEGELRYYKESGRYASDLYYCENCYGLTEWDGYGAFTVVGEAYPNRDKSERGKPRRKVL